MMEHKEGALKWSYSHNSPYELSKLTVMDFARTPCDIVMSSLKINKPNPNGTFTYTILTLSSYKYLGVIFNPKPKVVASTTWWIQQLW